MLSKGKVHLFTLLCSDGGFLYLWSRTEVYAIHGKATTVLFLVVVLVADVSLFSYRSLCHSEQQYHFPCIVVGRFCLVKFYAKRDKNNHL